jgi:hypothetical protein
MTNRAEVNKGGTDKTWLPTDNFIGRGIVNRPSSPLRDFVRWQGFDIRWRKAIRLDDGRVGGRLQSR